MASAKSCDCIVTIGFKLNDECFADMDQFILETYIAPLQETTTQRRIFTVHQSSLCTRIKVH